MKKIFLLIIIVIIYELISNVFSDKVIIPDNAIRIRILANSNSDEDQNKKLVVKGEVEPYLNGLLSNTKSYKDAKNIIKNNMDNIKEVIKNVNSEEFNVNFGKNYFPKKEFKGVVYHEGYYDSLLITLGNGLGDNWWCVLFPPLCLVDSMNSSKFEYKSFVGELISKYF